MYYAQILIYDVCRLPPACAPVHQGHALGAHTNTHTQQGQSTEGQAELAIGAEVRLTRLLLQPELNGTVYINMYLHTRDD
jgi:hypothetical protein